MGHSANYFPKQKVFITHIEGKAMPQNIWSHIITGVSAVTGMGVLQRVIISMQDKKIDRYCTEMKELLEKKQDKGECGLMNKQLVKALDDLKGAVNKLDDTQDKLVTEVAILNNNRKHDV